MLDLKQAGALVAELREADHAARTVDPALPLELARARREVDAAFASFEQRRAGSTTCPRVESYLRV